MGRVSPGNANERSARDAWAASHTLAERAGAPRGAPVATFELCFNVRGSDECLRVPRVAFKTPVRRQAGRATLGGLPAGQEWPVTCGLPHGQGWAATEQLVAAEPAGGPATCTSRRPHSPASALASPQCPVAPAWASAVICWGLSEGPVPALGGRGKGSASRAG